MLELHFTCPKSNTQFQSAQWSVDPDLETVTSPDGRKHLHGRVRVPCPICDASHVYAPNELACPLQHPTNRPPPEP